jgi:hypothetical protein
MVPDPIDYTETDFGTCLNCQCELRENYITDKDGRRFCSKQCGREWRDEHAG